MENGKIIEVGSYRKLPHYAVIGDPPAFYLWVNEDGRGDHSQWLTGNTAFNAYHKLRNLLEKDKTKFVAEVKRLHSANRKIGERNVKRP